MRILQVVNALDYGGVETYVIRLSQALKRLGHEAAIVSHGGVLESVAANAGVDVIKLTREPLARLDLIRSLRDGGFDVVNAHNYNSGRVGCLIAERLGLPYVLTVHGPRSFLKRLMYPCFSPLVIAMSEGDRRELIGRGGLAPERVVTTFAPVDVGRYHPNSVPEQVRRELLPQPDTKLILHVSRFSHRKTRVAVSLLDAVPEILRQEPRARILIIGAGPGFGRVEAGVARIAARLGPMVRIEHARDNLAAAFNSASVVLATAATAMEALACGAPVIAAGRTGYLGPLTRDRFRHGVEVMFADHGRCPRVVSPRVLAEDIVSVLRDNERWRAESASMAKTLENEFTPANAASHVLSIYERVIAGGEA